MTTGGTRDRRFQFDRNRHSANPVKPMKMKSPGSSTTSIKPTQADSPMAANTITKTGVKQQIANIIEPTLPTANSF